MNSSEALQYLHDGIQLSWQEIANLFGRSKRTIHNWAHGTPMSTREQARLELILKRFEPYQTREQLMAADTQLGCSMYRHVLRQARS